LRRLWFSFLCLSLLTLLATDARAQNWPSFRGPNASGVADGTRPPTTWDVEKSQNVIWKAAIPGLSHASPIVWGNRIFVITAISSDAQTGFIAKDRGIDLANDDAKHAWMIYALDKRTGQTLWSNKAYEGVPRAKRHVKATQANSTPVTDGRYVVALFGSEGLACYAPDGKLLWKQDLGVLNPGLWDDKDSSWGHASSPVIYRDLVIVQADGHKQSFIAAFNLNDGKQAWRVERNEITSWTTPAIRQRRVQRVRREDWRTRLPATAAEFVQRVTGGGGWKTLSSERRWRCVRGEGRPAI
jgi:outer membrane protein assembly factor BamB